MRRTLTLVAVTAALLVPASAASAAAPKHKGQDFNASCNSVGGGNYGKTSMQVSDAGQHDGCAATSQEPPPAAGADT